MARPFRIPHDLLPLIGRGLFALLIGCLTLPAVRAASSPPLEFAGGRAVSPPTLRASFPADVEIARNDSQFLAIWSSAGDVFGARLSAGDEPADAPAFPVVPTWAVDRPVAVLGAGDEWAVFNASYPLGGVAAIVRADGSLRAGTVFESHEPLAAAWNGTTYAVVLRAPGDALQLRLLDRDLREVARAAVAPKLDWRDFAGVVAAGSRFLVVWQQRNADPGSIDIVAQLFDEQGAARAPKAIAGASGAFGSARRISASWNGSSALVIWPGAEDFSGARIDAGGQVVERFSIPGAPTGGMLALGWDGRSHLLVWHDRLTMRFEAATLTSSGRIVQSFTLSGGDTPAIPSIAVGDDRFVVAAGGVLYAVRPEAIDRVAPLPPFAWGLAGQGTPMITASEQNLAIAWREADQLFVSLVAPNGERIGAPAGGFGQGYVGPVTSARTHHLITMLRPGKAPLGIILGRDAAGVVTLPVEGTPVAAASDGEGYLILRQKSSGYPARDELLVSRISDNGLTSAPLLTSEFDITVFSLRWTGTAWAVVWRKYVTAPCPASANCFRSYEDRLTLLRPDGTLLSEVLLRSAERAHAVDRIAAATVVGNRVVLASLHISPSPLGELTIETYGLDGKRETTSSAAVEWGTLSTRLSLEPKASGATLFATEYGGNTAVVAIGQDGRIGDSFTLADGIEFSSATHAFGATWITYTAGWRYLPQAHDNVMPRAYYRALLPRVRAVR